MKPKNIPLGKILNIPIQLDYSWFLIFILLTWSLATSYFPALYKSWTPLLYWVIGGATSLLLFVSVLLHELGHSVLALRYKIPVRKITLFIFGGVAQITREPPSAAAEFWIAIAGPVVSFMLAGIFYALQPLVQSLSPLLALAKYLAYINGILGLFNLIPGFPLDGGRVFRAILWGLGHNLHRATRIAGTVGRIIAFGFIGFGIWQIFLGNFFGGLWIAFIGWFLESAATSQLQQQALQDLLAGHTVGQAMTQNYALISPDITLQEMVNQGILGVGRRAFLVQDSNQIIGVLAAPQLKKVAIEKWPETTAAQAMAPLNQIHLVQSQSDLWESINEMEQEGVSQLPVLDDSQVQGVLSREGVISFMKKLQAAH